MASLASLAVQSGSVAGNGGVGQRSITPPIRNGAGAAVVVSSGNGVGANTSKIVPTPTATPAAEGGGKGGPSPARLAALRATRERQQNPGLPEGWSLRRTGDKRSVGRGGTHVWDDAVVTGR